MPRTVAAPCLPLVRKRPVPSPHRRRTLFRLADEDALPFRGQRASASFSASCVMGFLEPPVCVTTNAPW